MAAEKNYENKIKKYLDSKYCWYVKYFANRMTKSGIPDILACVNGYFVGIEVKSQDGRPSELQIWNVKKLQSSGGFAVIVKPSDWKMFRELIDSLMAHDCDRATELETLINKDYV